MVSQWDEIRGEVVVVVGPGGADGFVDDGGDVAEFGHGVGLPQGLGEPDQPGRAADEHGGD